MAGIAGFKANAFACTPLVPHELEAETDTLPATVPEVTVMVLVPAPEVMTQPAGKLQLYEVALATGETLYTNPAVFGQTGVGPDIVPGVAGAGELTTTANDWTELLPQELAANTVTVPFCPVKPAVTVMDVVPEPAVIDQPAGTVHEYDCASATGDIEYTLPVVPGQTAIEPLIAPGVAGAAGLITCVTVPELPGK